MDQKRRKRNTSTKRDLIVLLLYHGYSFDDVERIMSISKGRVTTINRNHTKYLKANNAVAHWPDWHIHLWEEELYENNQT